MGKIDNIIDKKIEYIRLYSILINQYTKCVEQNLKCMNVEINICDLAELISLKMSVKIAVYEITLLQSQPINK